MTTLEQIDVPEEKEQTADGFGFFFLLFAKHFNFQVKSDSTRTFQIYFIVKQYLWKMMFACEYDGKQHNTLCITKVILVTRNTAETLAQLFTVVHL